MTGLAAAALPDGRGWELASPANKNGGDVIPMSSRVRVASDGSAVGFSSLVGFGSVQGTTIGTEYLAERTGTVGTSGWVAHGISPVQAALPQAGAAFGLDPAYDGEMSADLATGVFRAFRPITDAPNVAGQINLYVRRDLRKTGAGTYQPITDPGFPLPTPFNPAFGLPLLAGASADYSHVIFESFLALTRDATPFAPNLYEWADGTLRLAGVLPDGTPAPASQAGPGALNQLQIRHMISADGSRIFFRDVSTGNIYMRIDGATTVQLNVSEKNARPRESPQGATLWDASVDGSRVFFDTTEGLVDGDDNGADDYYMYDAGAPAGQHLTLVSTDGSAGTAAGVIGASADGSYFYFLMGSGIFAWHDGVVRAIGSFDTISDVNMNRLSSSWPITSDRMKARVSADGTHVSFFTTNDGGFRGHGGFAGFDHGTACGFFGCRELYVYNAINGQLRCASCDPSGALPTGSAEVNVKVDSYASAISQTAHMNEVLTADGRWAFFSSPDPLVPEDVNGRMDAYEYDTVTGRVSLLSSGRSSDDSYFLDGSPSGRDAFIVTREQLVGWDTDGSYDLYDVRVGGGLPDPVTPPPGCVGEACQGATSAPVNPDVATSSGFDGKGDVAGKLKRHAKRKHCKKGTRRVVKRGKVRCVRRAAHRRHHAARSGDNSAGK